MFLQIDFGSDIAIYEQIRRNISIAIARGDLDKGQDLPSVRKLAEDLGVNLHTVNKAYKLLQEDGFIEMDRRYGTKVSTKVLDLKESQKIHIQGELEFLLSYLKNKNYPKEKIIEFIENTYDKEAKND